MPSPSAVPDCVNAAITRHLGLWLSPTALEAIAEEYGWATRTRVQQLYQAAVSQPAHWDTLSLPEQLAQVDHRLRAAYPFLTDASVQRLVNCFAYAWK